MTGCCCVFSISIIFWFCCLDGSVTSSSYFSPPPPPPLLSFFGFLQNHRISHYIHAHCVRLLFLSFGVFRSETLKKKAIPLFRRFSVRNAKKKKASQSFVGNSVWLQHIWYVNRLSYVNESKRLRSTFPQVRKPNPLYKWGTQSKLD